MTLTTDLEISAFPDSSEVNLVWKNYPTPTSSPLRKLDPIRSTTSTISTAADFDNPNSIKRPSPREIVVPSKMMRLEQNGTCAAAAAAAAAATLIALHHRTKSKPIKEDENPISNYSHTPTTPFERVILDRVHDLIYRQDQMHNQSIELIQTHENNRIVREQAWNLQLSHFYEATQHMRNQQTIRNLSIISFLQNLSQKNNNNKRWPQSEVKAMVSFRTAMDPNLKHHKIWEDISNALSSLGYSRDANKCKEKWDNINKYYLRRTAAKNNNVHSAKMCPYFHDLDLFYKNRLDRASSEELNASNFSEKTSD